MRHRPFLLFICLSGILALASQAQDPRIKKVLVNATVAQNGAVAQDKLGSIWHTNSQNGLVRFDGKESKTMLFSFNDSSFQEVLLTSTMLFDAENMMWLGFYNMGLIRYDMVTNQLTRYRYNKTDSLSIGSDTVTSILEDHSGNLWIGTYKGLNLLGRKTGRFTRYENHPGVANSLSNNHVVSLFEDKKGDLWVGTGSPSGEVVEAPEDGGLNKFDRTTGTFISYKSIAGDPTSLANNKVTALFEDSKGNFWVGTAGEGLHIMDRSTGKFKRFPYDPKNPRQLSGPPLSSNPSDHITFITEDSQSGIWICGLFGGLNRYDLRTQKVDAYGETVSADTKTSINRDPKNRLNDVAFLNAFKGADNSIWLRSFTGNIYNLNFNYATLPFYSDSGGEAYNFYVDTASGTVWAGTSLGLLQETQDGQLIKVFSTHPRNTNGVLDDYINSIRPDKQGKLWLAASYYLSCFDPLTGLFTNYPNEINNTNAPVKGVYVRTIAFDNEDRLWIGGEGNSLQYLDIDKRVFKYYPHSDLDTNSICTASSIYFIYFDKNTSLLWIATDKGLDRLNPATGQFKHYLKNTECKAVVIDHEGVIWAGSNNTIVRMKKGETVFSLFDHPLIENLGGNPALHILEDRFNNLWIGSKNCLLQIKPDRATAKRFGEAFGIIESRFGWSNNYQAPDGKLFFGDQHGHYAFYPEQIPGETAFPHLVITGLQLNNKEVTSGESSILSSSIWDTKAITLSHNQNSFSLEFISMNYLTDKPNRYFYKLENYDDNWHNLESYHKAVLVNVPPGEYIFHARVITDEGGTADKTLRITITPPWWKTKWAYALYVLLFLILSFISNKIVRNRIIEKERARSRERELEQAREIEKAYSELKATQAQLIQSEKMASLGQLTAGIAHEIQNPLNFVNNFSEVSRELIDELKSHQETLSKEEQNQLLNDLDANLEKITHHGKRADSIVKNMLQHSRSSTGQKELTDINSLADEYLRLAYHGIRARDKSFNAAIETDFDPKIGSINIAAQDISRVFLNLYNNAFDAMNEKLKSGVPGYAPLIKVQSKKTGTQVELTVSDNANGMSAAVADKIFQPFFTTKPAGQGTGLGLSVSYDIVKAHNGTLGVDSVVGKGSTFTLTLPSNTAPS